MEDNKDLPGTKRESFKVTLDTTWIPRYKAGKGNQIVLKVEGYKASIDPDNPDTIIIVNTINKTKVFGNITWIEI
jgi:hypothetical protein